MDKNLQRQLVNVLTLVVMLVVNGLANGLPLNGLTTGEISDRFDVYFVPAGYVFSIWGLIYLALIAFIIYQALPSQRENVRLQRIGYLFAWSSLANSAWIFFWHYELFLLTMIVMLTLLVLLIIIYLRLDIKGAPVSTAEKWLVDIPFSIYLGWITVATIANATSLLDYLKWDGFGISSLSWTVIMLAAGALISWIMALTRGDIAYLLVIVWAFVGIAVKHNNVSLVNIAAQVAAGLVLIAIPAAVLLGKTGLKLGNRPAQ
jgi:hypothetical protein